MKLNHILAALTLLLATFAMHSQATATLSTKTFEGQVMEVNHDEEGASIVLKTSNGLTQRHFLKKKNPWQFVDLTK